MSISTVMTRNYFSMVIAVFSFLFSFLFFFKAKYCILTMLEMFQAINIGAANMISFKKKKSYTSALSGQIFMTGVCSRDAVTYIRFQTGGTASQGGPWLCRTCRLLYSSSLDKASGSVNEPRTMYQPMYSIIQNTFKMCLKNPLKVAPRQV